ncbi:cation transporter [Coralloluteibacterium stylophorae]|uniref:Heavy-metal-associated domain-containing protein n=1 Tax=Coralloluteibacterium stylophorae TaxID=1776034 RepID=A0A8J7VTS4_9GAMM|nr:cation transporter [Coralloluteibacterium stylophorae]MBS7458270.1 heavy-metal-associated domain-containing protein [Coralloluteibacterium stylophorae]
MRLNVEGMTCAHCQRALERAVAALGGTATVDLAAGTVDVAGVEDAAALRRAIEDEGYAVVDAPVGAATGGCCGSR